MNSTIDSIIASTSEDSTSLSWTTESLLSVAVTSYSPSPASEWSFIFDICQLGTTTLGFIFNILTLVTLFIHYKGFNRAILFLLRHQALIDAIVCLQASIVIIQPFKWLSGLYYLDVLICYAWHGQAFYWGAVTLSTYNLVCISIERFLAVIKPFSHATLSNLSKKKAGLYIFLLNLLTLVVTHGTYIQTKLTKKGCVNEYAFGGLAVETYFFAFVVFTYVATYLVPVIIMMLMYSAVVIALNKRSRDERLGHSRVIDRASSDLTKTAIVVTIIFTITIGYDLHYYLLGYTGVVVYALNTPLQKVGVFLSNLNSWANPVVYACLMPQFRRSLFATFCCYGNHVRTESTNSLDTTVGATSTSQLSLSIVSSAIDYRQK